ncbi:MKI67 FHA domain-interacting nucleolar phosphoprotein-like [Ylistrum balloti]|uniref:MKI67 FHA domain-interacting nucleolar phosphoprotein-like n=1 Tax=Ylistrum balloti TaxID=509963 RepID=UPI002905A4C4|nr:MKI67 FHA domain-interacting nucleolar phosphoprotein-like [Ylistrum balloti]
MAASIKKRGPEDNIFEMPPNVCLEPEQQTEFENKVKDIKEKNQNKADKGVIYLGHIPHGFFEPQMKSFFGQFGTVTRLKLSRSVKTGHSKGYAFVEFLYEDVAKVVAETMNNYLMFERLLKCKFIPNENVHEDTFKGSGRKVVPFQNRRKNIHNYNETKPQKDQLKSMRRFMSKNKKKAEKLKALGIEFNYAGMEQLKEESGKLAVEVQKNRQRNRDRRLIEQEFEQRKKEELKIRKKEKRAKNRALKVKKMQELEASQEQKSSLNHTSDKEDEIMASPDMSEKDVMVECKKTALSKAGKYAKSTPQRTGKPKSKRAVKSESKKAEKSLLIGDSEDDEISFKTPPNAVRISKRNLAQSVPVKSSRKGREIEESTPVTTAKKQKMITKNKTVTRPVSSKKKVKSSRKSL